jgi:hypothetical protein
MAFPHYIPLLPNTDNTCFLSVCVQLLRTLVHCDPGACFLRINNDPVLHELIFSSLKSKDIGLLIQLLAQSIVSHFPNYQIGSYFCAEDVLTKIMEVHTCLGDLTRVNVTETWIRSCTHMSSEKREFQQYHLNITSSEELGSLSKNENLVETEEMLCNQCSFSLMRQRVHSMPRDNMLIINISHRSQSTLPPQRISFLELSAIILCNLTHFIIVARRGSLWLVMNDNKKAQYIKSAKLLFTFLMRKLAGRWRFTSLLYTSKSLIFLSVFLQSTSVFS